MTYKICKGTWVKRFSRIQSTTTVTRHVATVLTTKNVYYTMLDVHSEGKTWMCFYVPDAKWPMIECDMDSIIRRTTAVSD